MNRNEQSRLAHAINDLRPDWPASSLATFIDKNLSNRPYRDVAVALTWVAVDTSNDGTPASQTPKRVLEAGPWWTAATAHDGKVRGNYPPKRDEQCRTHAGQWADNCGGCRTDALAWDADDSKPTNVRPASDPHAAADAIRAQLRNQEAS